MKGILKIMNCNFCKKIWETKREYQDQFKYRTEENIAIVKDNGDIGLYVPIDDWYYSDVIMTINYCPKCGKRLIDDKTIYRMSRIVEGKANAKPDEQEECERALYETGFDIDAAVELLRSKLIYEE